MKLSFLAGLGAGYVLGARSGRERYEQITEKARELWSDPRVQEKADQAQRVVKRKAEEAGVDVDSSSGPTAGSGGSAGGTGAGAEAKRSVPS